MTLTNKARAGYSSITIRGGRMTKLNGQAASYAPHVATAGLTTSSSALAIGLAIAGVMLTPGEAQAGTCVQTPPASGVWVCSGPAGADTTQPATAPAGAPITVTTVAGFGLTVAAGNGVLISGGGTNTGISFVDTNASTISASINGIFATNNGSGALSITSTGTVNGTGGYGINGYNSGNGTDLTITANNSSGGRSGMRAYNAGSGALSVTSTGTATGAAYFGIRAVNSGNGTDLTVTANDSYGGWSGIATYSLGSGALSVTSTGTATGAAYSGITASNSTIGTDLTVTSNDASGGQNGIFAYSLGSGALSITSTGTASGTGRNGIAAYNFSNGTDLTVTANNSSGGRSGISSQNNGSGALSITSTGTASGTNGYGIAVRNSSNGTDLTVTANDSYGGRSGIYAFNNGSGALSITSTGTTTGTTYDGIFATNRGTSLTVTTGGATTGGDDGIDARNYGTGGLTITANADVTGQNGMGIRAYNSANDTTASLVINQAAGTTTTGAIDGINANNFGGSLTINGLGTSVGTTGTGVFALNNTGTTTLTANINNATGAVSGIVTGSYGSGGAVVNLSGTAQGGTGAAIDTFTGAGGPGCTNASCLTTINLAAGSQALAGSSGVAIRNNAGNSVLNVANGAVISGEVRLGDGNDIATITGVNALAGITVLDGGDDADTADGMIDVLTLNGVTATVNAGQIINWEVLSLNNSTITATGLVTGTVNVCGGSTTLTSSTIGAGGVLGCVSNDSITLNGTTTVAGPVQGAGGADTINVLGSASVTGGVYGGGAGQDASAAADTGDTITINTTGTVSLVDGQLGGDTINLNSGTIGAGGVSGGLTDAGNDTVNWNAAAATTPLITMGNGSDTININSAAINLTSVTLNGGDDVSSADGWTDRLNLNAAWSGSLNGANTTNWEEINVGGGTVAFSNAAVTVGVINVNGGGTLNASNNLAVTGNVSIGAGSRMVVGTNGGTGLATISGNLTNSGTLDFRSMTGTSATGDRLTVGGNYTGASGSVIRFDTVLGGSNATDLMVVNGNLAGTSAVTVYNVGGTGSLTTGDGIRLVQVDGTSASGALSLAGGPNIDVGAFRYQLYNGGLANPADQDWYLRSGVRDIVPPTITVARVAQDAGLNSLGTLHERVGEQEHYGKMTGLDEGYFKGMWGRALGSDYSETGKSSAFGNTRSNGQFGGLQMGIDFYRGITDGGSRIHFGGYAGHLWSGTSDFTVTPIHRGPVGTTRSDGWVAGGYLTYYTPSGFYVDAVVQGDWLNHRLNAADGTSARTKSNGLLGSVEMGKSFGSSWKFEPQVQVIYSTSNVDNFTDSAGVLNRIDNDNSWTGRAGFRLKRTWDNNPNSDGGLFTFYGKANIWGRLDGGTSTLTVGVSNPGAVQYKGVWGDVGVGTTFSIGKGAEFFTDADVEFGIDQGATALSGRAGFRLKF